MEQFESGSCPEGKMTALLASIKADEQRGMKELDVLLQEFPSDARLHFLKGSLRASEQDYAGAYTSMRRAVDIAPDFQIARFQLGFVLFTSGKIYEAQEVWGPLHALPDSSYLVLFVKGLCRLIVDDFPETVRYLEQGIASNRDNEPLNRDMRLIIDQIHGKQGSIGSHQPVSSVDFLLQQAALKPKH